MKPARSHVKLKSPYTWSELSNGQWISESIQTRLDEWCPKLFGYHMLKLGGLSSELSCHLCNIPHQVNLDCQNPLHHVIAKRYELPFLEKSFDAVLMAHQLDYSDDPHRMLREVDRVMMDDGYLLITGFNPLSLTGLANKAPWRSQCLPWNRKHRKPEQHKLRMFTPNRIKDWLGVLNYQVVHSERYALMSSKKSRPCWLWIESSLGDITSHAGSLYFIVARKRTYPLKPIKRHWRLRRRVPQVGLNYRMKP